MQPSLPLELIISIISSFLDEPRIRKDNYINPSNLYIYGYASRHLLTCSLVCHTWKDVCQALIFRWVRIISSEHMVDGFSFLHSTVPHLCKHVLEFSLVFTGDVESFPRWFDECLGRFKNLRKLEVICWSTWVMGTSVSLRLAQGIASLLGTISLKHLSLLYWNDFDNLLRILPACPATLEHLTIRGDGGLYTLRTQWPTVRLETLRHVELHAILHPFFQRNTVECPNLESFTISHSGSSPWELPSWIPASIQKLVLQGTSHFNSILTPLDTLCSLIWLRWTSVQTTS